MADSYTLSQTQWLIRKTPALMGEGLACVNPILGPYMTSQVRSMVEQGMLDLGDEICPENGYWFALSDAGEVRKHLGIEPPALRALGTDEVTQPDLTEETTQSELVLEGMPPMDPESTGVIKVSRPSRNAAKLPTSKKPPLQLQNLPPQSAESIGMQYPRVRLSAAYGFQTGQFSRPPMRVEKGRFWAIVLAISVGLAVIGVVWAIRMLHPVA